MGTEGTLPPGPTFEELKSRSRSFPVNFPTSSNRIEAIVQRAGADRERVARAVEQHARGTRVVVHWRVWRLLGEFLAHRRRWGSAQERALYAALDPAGLVRRLITLRPLTFMKATDTTLLRSGEFIPNATNLWDTVGVDGQTPPSPPPLASAPPPDSTSLPVRTRPGASPKAGKAPSAGGPRGVKFLPLSSYLSYDEIQVAALLGVSTPTLFINSGSRNNRARPAAAGEFEPQGVQLGLVGARFQRPRRMEDEWVVVRPSPGGGARQEEREVTARWGESAEAAAERSRMWMHALGVPEDVWSRNVELRGRLRGCDGDKGAVGKVMEEAGGMEGMVVLHESALFDVCVYKARMRVTAEVALVEANERAKAQQCKAYLHVVGLGLGVWKVHPKQTEWFLDAFAEALETIALPCIDTIDFSWFPGVSSCGRHRHGAVTDPVACSGNRIKILFSKRDPAAPLGRGMGGEQLLLVAIYAWDGNAYPGNEYWVGSLSGSGDPAAVCCSTIGELQNPLINDFTKNIAVMNVSENGGASVDFRSF